MIDKGMAYGLAFAIELMIDRRGIAYGPVFAIECNKAPLNLRPFKLSIDFYS